MTNNALSKSRLGVMSVVAVGITVIFGALGFFGIRTFLDSRQSTVVSADERPSPSPSATVQDTEPGAAKATEATNGASTPGPDSRTRHSFDDGSDTDTGPMIGADEYYWNGRYGYSIDLPEGWEAREADNGDGLTMTSPEHSGEIVVYGTNVWPLECGDAGETTVSECADARASALEDEGFNITYQQTKDDWFVVSGSDPHGQGTYERWYLGPGSVNVVVVNFPMSERDIFDDITTRLSKSLSPGDLSVPH
jgi:hypothetical protein